MRGHKELYLSLITWAVVILLIRVFSDLQSVSWISTNLATISAVLLVYPPVIISLIQKERLNYWAVQKDNLILSIKILGWTCLAIFPAAFVINHFYQLWFFGANYHAGHSKYWEYFILSQVFLVSFPEEFFFRGFLQEKFSKVFPPKKSLWHAPFGKAHIYVSMIFALSHSVIHLQWWHALIFFPSLVFCWLKERTGTIWAASLFHALCNIFAYWVALHY